MRKFNQIAPFLLLTVFLFPSIVKLEHHHDNFTCHAKHEKHWHVYHEKCEVCNFEFSTFSSDSFTLELQNEQPSDSYLIQYTSRYSQIHGQYSFLLRGPPFKQI